jgi:fructosamine-3-kinase
MTLQSSGAISFANLQTEFGGSHPITMGEYSSFSGIGATSEVSLSDFYGLSAIKDTQTVTVGTQIYYGITYTGHWTYLNLLDFGSISDGTCNFKSGAAIDGIHKVSTTSVFTFTLDGTHSNEDWTTMTVNSNNYTRTSATFTQTGGKTRWFWNVGSTNPFGVTSGTVDVTWT